jgi:hypothetical protein
MDCGFSVCDWIPKFLHRILSGLERVLFGSRLGFVAVLVKPIDSGPPSRISHAAGPFWLLLASRHEEQCFARSLLEVLEKYIGSASSRPYMTGSDKYIASALSAMDSLICSRDTMRLIREGG